MTAPTPDTDVAYAAGAEAMREAVVYFMQHWVHSNSYHERHKMLFDLRQQVARLPLPPAPESTP